MVFVPETVGCTFYIKTVAKIMLSFSVSSFFVAVNLAQFKTSSLFFTSGVFAFLFDIQLKLSLMNVNFGVKIKHFNSLLQGLGESCTTVGARNQN